MNIITGHATLKSSESSTIEIVSESLNAVFDIYADGEFEYDEPVFVNMGYNALLKGAFAGLRERVKKLDKRKHKIVRERADEALMNLKAFIQYKENELKLKKRQ